MPMPALKHVEPFRLHLPDPEPVEPAIVAIDGAAATWAESPARLLHDRLVQSFATPRIDDDPQLLPAPTRLAILVGSTAALWAVIGTAAYLFLG